MFKNLNYYFQSIPLKNRFHLVVIFLGLLLVTLLEMFSLAAIPGFVAVIIDTENLAKFIPIEFILNLLSEYDKNSLVVIFSI